MNKSNFEMRLAQLSAPYVENEAYEIFASENENEFDELSKFWSTSIGYVVKYKNEELQDN